jgi:hypothetical protein
MTEIKTTMPSTLKKATIAWAILGIPVLLILLFCRDWNWLMIPYMTGVFVLALLNPVRRAESGRLTESPMPLVWLAIPAVALTYAAVYTFDDLLIPLVAIVALVALAVCLGNRSRQAVAATTQK